MAAHFLLSSKARTLSLAQVMMTVILANVSEEGEDEAPDLTLMEDLETELNEFSQQVMATLLKKMQ